MGKTIFIIFIILIFPLSALGKTKVIVYGDDSYPPYCHVENGELKGIYTEILKTAFSRMGAYDISIKGIPWKRGLLMLKNGTAFALYPPYFWQAQRPYMDYSIPILEEKLVIFLNGEVFKKRRLEKWPGDFIGLKIGKNAGFIVSQNMNFTDLVNSGQIMFEEADDNRMNILKLGKGRIDAYLNDRISILWELRRLKQKGEFQEGIKHFSIFEGPTISTKYGYLGFTKSQSHQYHFKADFKKRFNQEIKRMKQNGEIKRIITKFSGE